MINLATRNIFRFIILVLVQALVLNNIYLSGYVNPFLYILFMLLLPINISPSLVLFISFLTGLSIDVFADTGGLHAAASLFLAFCRHYVLKFLSPREGYEYVTEPTIKELGFPWFLIYGTTLIFLHHLFLFYAEVFRFSEFFATLARVLLSSLVTTILLFLVLFIFQRKNN